MVECDRGADSCMVTGFYHPLVVIELGNGKASGTRLDPRPFDREAICVESHRLDQGNVLAIAVIAVAGIAGALDEHGRLDVLQQPHVAVDVAALDLMSRGRDAPEEI